VACLQSYSEDPYYTIYTVSIHAQDTCRRSCSHVLPIPGSKDISLLGAAHSFNHDRLREETLRRYPDIANEQNNHGLLALIRDHIINLDFLHNPPSIQPDVEKGPSSSDGEKNTQKDPLESSESVTIEKPSNLVSLPEHSLDVNMPSTGLNDRENLNILRPVRRRPDGA